jgi:hypothetical protein
MVGFAKERDRAKKKSKHESLGRFARGCLGTVETKVVYIEEYIYVQLFSIHQSKNSICLSKSLPPPALTCLLTSQLDIIQQYQHVERPHPSHRCQWLHCRSSS